MPKALILTVGMGVDSEVFAIEQLRPDWVALICTSGSHANIDRIVERTGLRPSCYTSFEVEDDPQKIGDVVAKAHEAFRLAERKFGSDREVVINPTAGRKWMSTGLNWFAVQADAKLVYVDAKYTNGQPDPATMHIVDLGNPDDATAMYKAEPAIKLFNRGDFEGATEGFAGLKPSLSAPKRLYENLKCASAALVQWDRFEHYAGTDVHTRLERAADEVRQVAEELHMSDVKKWAHDLTKLAEAIRRVSEDKKPSLLAVADLVSNAERKARQGRYDDACARLYRALEGIAQYLLSQKDVNASNVNWNAIEDRVKGRFQGLTRRRDSSFPARLSLTDAFALAHALGCEGAERFFEGDDFALKDKLETRNQSILAHGWTPVKPKQFETFKEELRKRCKGLMDDRSFDDFRVPVLPNLWT